MGNAPFRLTIKSALLVGALGATSLIHHHERVERIFALAGVLALLAVPFAGFALRGPSTRPPFVRLFAPTPSRWGEVVYVLSYFTFTDPGEVSWHAVSQQRSRPGRRVRSSVILYVVLVLPAAVMLDWLLPPQGPTLTLAAMIYLPPWTSVRWLEERARRRDA